MRRLSRLSSLGALALALVPTLFMACGDDASESEGSETHFLKTCELGCAAAESCVCGVCTKSCEAAEECASLSVAASCIASGPRIAELRCPTSTVARSCDVECVKTSDCAHLGGDFSCWSGFCRSEQPIGVAPRSCTPPAVASSELLVMGDSLIELTSFVANIEALALDASLLASGEHYRSTASSLMSFIATGPFSIDAQYTGARAERVPRVAVFDGGATDVLNDECGSTPSADCKAIEGAVAGAEQLLARLAEDGVEHVVYFFYPDVLEHPTLRASLDVMRPLMQNVCGKSSVACHWLDLRPIFAEHPEFIGPDGIVFSESGAKAAATAVFALLRERCAL
jgi:hypothetical protein